MGDQLETNDTKCSPENKADLVEKWQLKEKKLNSQVELIGFGDQGMRHKEERSVENEFEFSRVKNS